jgi:hypothetical protein
VVPEHPSHCRTGDIRYNFLAAVEVDGMLYDTRKGASNMLYRLRRHALPIKAHFRTSLVLAYAVPAPILRPLLPAGLIWIPTAILVSWPLPWLRREIFGLLSSRLGWG